MIHRDGAVTRVERDERRMRAETGVGVGIAVVLAGYFAAKPVQPLGALVAGGLVVVALILLLVGLRRRPVCVIEEGRVGCGLLGGRTRWYDRERVASVAVVRVPLTAVRLYDRSGHLFAGHVLSFFDPDELRAAFTSAGIRLRP